ncbi:MAG: nucleoside triphosphate pyrophosphohydrolase [Chitinophagaceae bacterium]|nr:nucleoside triphosphate pyrophosphohydrolase [Chitinophagaceae bacterium]
MINGISEKLISRHPHIYGDVKADSAEEVKKNWENLKLKEGKKSVIGGVPRSLPAMVKAMRLQEKAKVVGFEWENRDQVWEKVEEETRELKEAVALNNPDKVEEELGDLFFSLINYARFLQLDAENALERTNKKFIHRFTQMESKALADGKDLASMSLEEMDAIWNSIKKQPNK